MPGEKKQAAARGKSPRRLPETRAEITRSAPVPLRQSSRRSIEEVTAAEAYRKGAGKNETEVTAERKEKTPIERK
ncbi:hypothetical protein HPP92_028740 [Vanilla planifolia]|uniref:Uncharacterized protein n=1 Tax=Vanilla planifolia TaxID=51239 RepID=A0A835P7L2_VANPL|nr:hypothetical protein HPP92_028740 [Vanilla planifolia]KAG0446687.1 hypothetical protein HPP92_028729 [Vanilla planifolia]